MRIPTGTSTFLRRAATSCALFGAVSTIACSDTVSAPDLGEVRLMNPVAWPGSDIVIIAAAFARTAQLPEVVLGSARLDVARRDDSTVTARLPDTSGVFTLTLRLGGDARVGSMRIVGYLGHRDAPALSGWALPLAPGSPIVIAGIESTLARLDMRTGAALNLGIGHSGRCSASPGPSYRANTVVAHEGAVHGPPRCSRPLSWELSPTPVVRDSAPATWGDRLWAELAPAIWLVAAPHRIDIYRPGQPTFSETVEEAERLVRSPDGALAVVLSNGTAGQVPVLDATAGTIAFRLPLKMTQAVAFSPEGDTIFAAGVRLTVAGEPTRLIAAAAASGEAWTDRALDIAELWDLVVDPDGPWLYGLATTIDHSSWLPVIHVFDRRTLGPIARMLPPPDAACRALFCGQVTLAMDPSTRRLYALEVQGWRNFASIWLSRVYSFEAVPAQQQPVVLDH